VTLSGGTGGTTGGTAGMSTGTGGMYPAVPFPTLADCPTLANDVAKDCAGIGCHRVSGVPAPSGLVLTPDDGFVGRVKDVLAKHQDIYCADIKDTCPTIPTSCPTTAMLVESDNWEASWLLTKLRGMQDTCGDAMPPAIYDPAHELCFEELIMTIAAMK